MILVMQKGRVLIAVLKKLLIAALIGIGCFFFGIFLILASPVIALLSLFPASEKNKINWSDKLKKLDEKLKEMQDPDCKEDWKKRHKDLYGEDEDV